MRNNSFIVGLFLILGLLNFPIRSMADDIGTVSCSSTTATQFVPSWGHVDIGEMGGIRYAHQEVYWNSASRLSWFWTNYDSTFEPELTFYNYDSTYGPAYGSVPSGYWNSNLPSPYVDTQAFDGPGEKAVTIGSAFAININKQTYYYTHTDMTNGGGTRSIFKVSSQRGRRVPSNCTSTWCSYGCSTTSNIPIVTFQQHVWAPGGLSYTYP